MIKLGQMVLKAVNWVQSDKIRSNGLESSQLGTHTKIRSYGLERSHMVWKEWFGYTTQTSGQMVLKGVNWVHNDKLGHMVLKGVICVHNVKFRSNGLDMSWLGKQYKNQVIWSWKESICYKMQKSGQNVLKGVNWANWVHNVKISSYGLERSQLGTHW